jgi:hypothetical protein
MGRSTDISSAYGAAAVSTNDTTVIPTTRALYIGTTGNVAVRIGGSNVTLPTVPVGVLPVQVDKVLSTGTTASNIFALY